MNRFHIKTSFFTVSLIFLSLLLPISATAATKVGSTCKKPHETANINGVAVKCVKSGKKYQWQKINSNKRVTSSKVTAPPSSSTSVSKSQTSSSEKLPATEIALPNSFSDLEERSKGIPRAAWKKGAQIIEKSSPRKGTLEILTGPNTQVTFDDYPKVLALVSQLFPDREVPKKNYVFRYSFADLDWAERKVRELLSENDYEDLNRNEGGRLVSSNCDSGRKTCIGSKQQTAPSGTSVIFQGIPPTYDPYDPNGRERLFSGMLEAHEYFHALQRIPMLNKEPRSEVWPHAWFREGSAEWVQNVTINRGNFEKYSEYRKNNCQGACGSLTKKDITKYLESANGNEVLPEFDRWLEYSLGGLVVEALVAVSGPDSIIAMYEEMSRRIDFNSAFKKVYGIEWKEAIPIVAAAIYKNL